MKVQAKSQSPSAATKFDPGIPDRLRGFLLGSDIFISYSRADSLRYAQRLANQLARFGFICYLDQLSTKPDRTVPDVVKNAIRRSTSLVLIGSKRATVSSAVREEVAIFLENPRNVIAINVDDALKTTEWDSILPGLALVDESEQAVILGRPSRYVLSRIYDSAQFTRRNKKLLRVFWSILSSIVLLLIVGGAAASVLTRRAAAAEMRANNALETGKRAEENARLASERANDANRKAATADGQRVEAEGRAKDAGAKAVAAELAAENALDEKQKAEAQVAAAEDQLEVTTARRMAAQAEVIRDQEPRQLQRSLLVGIESLNRRITPEGLQAVRQSMSLLPYPLRGFAINNEVNGAQYSSDGHYLAVLTTQASDNQNKFLVTVFNTETNSVTAVIRPLGFDGSMWLSPDGKNVVTVATVAEHQDSSNVLVRDQVVELWNNTTATEVWHKRYAMSGGFIHISFSKTGRYLALAVGEEALLSDSWRTSDPDNFVAFHHAKPLKSIDFSPDELQFLTCTSADDVNYIGSKNCEVHFWRIDRHQEAPALTDVLNAERLIMSPREDRLVALNSENLQMWDLNTRVLLWTLPGHNIRNVVFRTKLGQELMVEESEGVTIWDYSLRVPQRRSRFQHFGNSFLNRAELSPNQDFLATAGADGTARVWDISLEREVARMTHDENVLDIAFSPEGKKFYTVGVDHKAFVWEVTPRPEAKRIRGNGVNRVTIPSGLSPDGNYIATVSGSAANAVARIRRITDDSVLRETPRLEPREPEVGRFQAPADNASAAFSSDGHYLAVSGHNLVRIWKDWDLPSVHQLLPLRHNDPVGLLAFANYGRYLATVSGKTAYVWLGWDGPSAYIARVVQHDKNIRGVALSPDGFFIATASDDMTARITEISTGKEIILLHTDRVTSLAFNHVGNLLATGSRDGTVRVWNWRNGRAHVAWNCTHLSRIQENGFELRSFDNFIVSVSFSSNGLYLATANSDNGVRLWNLSDTGRDALMRISLPEARAVAFSSDNRYLITESWGEVEFWFMNSIDIRNESRNRLIRNLTKSEWNRYLPFEKYHETFPDLRLKTGTSPPQ